jgi:hypothetical protein
MFQRTLVEASPVVCGQLISFPLRLFIAVDDEMDPAQEEARPYDFAAGMAAIFQGAGGAERRDDVVELFEWPAMHGFAGGGGKTHSRFIGDSAALDGLRPLELEGVRRYDIAYLRAAIVRASSVDAPALTLHRYLHIPSRLGFGPADVFSADGLCFRLVRSKARLLVLHVLAAEHSSAKEVGVAIATAGGPSVLIVSGAAAAATSAFFTAFFARVFADDALSDAAEAAHETAGGTLLVDVVTSVAGDALLSHGALIASLEATAAQHESDAAALMEQMLASQQAVRPYLHGDQIVRAFEASNDTLQFIRDASSFNSELVRTLGSSPAPFDPSRAAAVRNVHVSVANLGDWIDQSRSGLSMVSDSFKTIDAGKIPLPSVPSTMPRFPNDYCPPRGPAPVVELVAASVGKVVREVRRAPRVLNAAFGDQARNVIPPAEALVEEQPCMLLVDIGPRWDKLQSIATGNDIFPQRSLVIAPEQAMVTLDVVLLSDDIVERMSAASLRLPVEAGRSRPSDDAEPGPVAIPFTPRALENVDSKRLRGRVLVYQGINVLQSGMLEATVRSRTAAASGAEPAVLALDYAVSGGFLEVDRFDRRAMSADATTATEHSVAMSIALNDDGGGGHRIVLRDVPDAPPLFRSYDPEAAKILLANVRDDLLGCFYGRDPSCVRSDDLSRRPANARSFNEFTCDLYNLAWTGSRIYEQLFAALRTTGSTLTFAQLNARLRELLEKTTVIQVANTGPGNYVFPWALIYDYPISVNSAAELNWCSVIYEWLTDGGKDAPAARSGDTSSCPYGADLDHKDNILCPFGFWGLRHFIEQPIPSLNVKAGENASRTIAAGGGFDLAVGISRDTSLDQDAIDAHLAELRSFASFSPQTVADTWPTVQTMLEAPSFAYFLCHGEYDTGEGEPFLGVGLRDGDLNHRVYPRKLLAWAQTRGEHFWEGKAPLIFINGCETANLTPGQVMDFVSAFGTLGATSVIGTEVSMRLPVAIEIGQSVLERMRHGASLGVAIRDVRWALAEKGNLLGLAYTPYGLIDAAVPRKAATAPAPAGRTATT